MLSNLAEIEQEINSFNVTNKEELEQFRLKFISRNGLVTKLFEELKNVSKEEKPLTGKKLNEVKKLAEGKFNSLKESFENDTSAEEIDLTLPGRTFRIGREHIIMQTLNEFVKIFREICFKVTEGPELEEEFYNFDALNAAKCRTSCAMHDTLQIQTKPSKDRRNASCAPTLILTILG